ncbi:MAG: hypothetical protein AB7H97_22595, partial [Pseudobdellovibrionaceae bacterium]
MLFSNNDWKIWALVAALAVGGIFEVVKHSPGRSTVGWDGEGSTLRGKEKAYSVPHRPTNAAGMAPHFKAPPRAILPTRPVVAAEAPIPNLTKDQVDKFLQQAQGPQKKMAKDDEWETVIDPKTGKKIKRKKKKKKVAKKPKKKEEEVAAKPEKTEEEPTKTDDKNINAAIAEVVATGSVAPPVPNNKPDDAFTSAEEWIKKLLNRPDLAETKRFIDHYNKNLVTAEVFYKVVGMMIEDPRPEMKKLGVLAAGASQSVMSFQLLAEV